MTRTSMSVGVVLVIIAIAAGTAHAQGKRAWGPAQATGQPDTMRAGDSKTAWATLKAEMGEQWLDLTFETAIVPAKIRIYENFNPGAVSKVEVFDEAGTAQVIWEGIDSNKECPGYFEVAASVAATAINRVKVYLDTNRVKGWNEIDAVAVVPKDGEPLWAAKATASSSYADARRRSAPPRIVSTIPEIGASDVDPSLSEISVTFDQDMASGFSWTGRGPLLPKTTGRPFWRQKRTCVLPVRLESGHFYRVGINSGKRYSSFRSEKGIRTATWAIWFTTQGAPAEAVAGLKQPKIVSTVPEIGDQEVDPNLTEIKITFDQEMGGGFSMPGGGTSMPKATGRAHWDSTKRTCIRPVQLEPNHRYRFGINSYSYKNFSSAYGVPVSPIVFHFKTRGE